MSNALRVPGTQMEVILTLEMITGGWLVTVVPAVILSITVEMLLNTLLVQTLNLIWLTVIGSNVFIRRGQVNI